MLLHLFFFCACTRSTKEPGDVAAEPSTPVENVAIAAPEPSASPPVLDENAINDEGLVVLQAPQADPAIAATPSDGAASDRAPATESTKTDLPIGANVTSAEERKQLIAANWPEPQAVIFVSGQQHGYIEPCGCTGLENQKGGLIRRDTLITQLRERGWEVIPVDVGNQVRRIGRQPELKFQTTVEAFKKMGYKAATLGIDDLKLSSIELIQMAGSDGLTESPFISSNVSVVDPSFFPGYKIVEAGGRKIGITAALGNELSSEVQSSDIQILNSVEKLKEVIEEFDAQKCDFRILLAHASLEESAEMARQVKGFDLVVTAGGFGEPTLRPEPIDGSSAVMVQVGTKGMYSGIVGLFDDPEHPIRYQKLAISSQFKDSARMLEEFATYQNRLKDAGFKGLGIVPAAAHPTGRKYVGAEVCGDCHTTAYEIWENSPHVFATDSIVEPDNERGGITRQFDPECISCHATGWNAQNFYPYESGFMSLSETPHLVGSGCENCHGPGSEHAAAELGDIDVTNERLKELQQQMILPLDRAREKCLECHDLDNSPDFHVDGAFDEYWEQVKHYGKD